MKAERSSQVGGGARGRVHLAQQRDGPTAEANDAVDGSMVVGAVSQTCTPDPTAIPWLLLSSVFTEGPGVFDGVSFIHVVIEHGTEGADSLQEVPAFQAFVADIGERCDIIAVECPALNQL